MTRAPLLAVTAMLAVVACSAPEAPQATSTPAPVAPPANLQPVVVHIQVPEDAGPGVEAWAQALATAINAGYGGLTLAPTPDAAVAVVRIDAVETGVPPPPPPEETAAAVGGAVETGATVNPEPEGEGEINVMRGALVVGESARAFNLSYRGDARPQAEALARNLRRFAAEGGTGPAAAAPAEPEEAEAEPEDAEATAEDQG